ncbi:MAG: PTS ascorbate transporter subunit IIC [Clostridia bacterium]|nr:PTS ascorbate transporter subunit IIC [Clostridia bacterium]
MPEKDNKKQIPLRVSKTLYDELARWAEDDFRSINGQIEYLLTEAVKRRRRGALGESSPETPADPPESDGE